ncbi:MAG: DUF2384 domain-containing protein [Flammeovirgaceae bacterium]|nr:DUF2384 domain-containing protein [Flammeovirgaceae bacterium]
MNILKDIKEHTSIELSDLVEQGLPFTLYLNFQRQSCFTQNEMARCLSVSMRYLQNKTKSDTLNKPASERLIILSRIWDAGLATFDGNKGMLNQWLRRPLISLHSRAPLQLMTNVIGMEEVKQLIGRIQHGVYS